MKKLGRIPTGGGWRALGRTATVAHQHKKIPIGYDHVHSAVDDHSRAAYAEVLPDERGETAAAFLLRAAAWFAAHGIAIERVMTDNAYAYRRAHAWHEAMASIGARQVYIRPHCPWTNGKVERFHRTLLTEWAYAQPFTSSTARAGALRGWLKHYNTRRRHTALGGQPPLSRLRVNQVPGQYS